MHSGCTLLARPLEVLICLSVPCTLAVSFDWWSAKRYIMPFGAMHAGSSLLAHQHRGILCLSVLCTLAHLFWLVSTERYIMPFVAMHAGSSLLARQHRAQRYIMPFDAMHAGSSVLARQHRAAGQVRVLHVPSRYQFADIFTKGLPSALFEEFRTSLSVRCPPAPTAGEC
ncbi:hypothetical protein Tco_0169961 [Tanacetum coccineum]